MASVPKISNVEETNNVLKFTISEVNVSYANAIRRTIISDVPCIVIRTQPYSKNDVNIIINKTRLNNELIKQRISSIPIYIQDVEQFPYEDYIIELEKENTENTIIFATSEDFKIKNIKTNKYLHSGEVKKIFPPDPITGDYIDIVRLRPQLATNMDKEIIKFEAKLSIGTAKEDGMFNVACTCAYGNTLDAVRIKDEWEIKHKELKESFSKDKIEFLKKDWMLLDAKRLFLENSFDYIIESVGVFNNLQLMELACSILIKKIYVTLESLKNNNDLIADATDTMDNCYIIILENEDYTVGKILEYNLYNKYFVEKKELNYVGFLKKHPHDNNSIIKLSFKNITQKDDILLTLEECANSAILLLNTIKDYFSDK